MEEDSDSGNPAGNAPAFWEQRRLCLEHAGDLIASAQRVLANDSGYPNIAYHLAVLAVEEIGKAGMLAARGIVKGALDPSWMEKRLNNHVWKFMWAVWSPSLSGGKIDPKSFEEARRFAEDIHARRMAGLYVNSSEDSAIAPPRDAVRLDQVTSLLNFAKAGLELETARAAPVQSEEREELLEWFFETVDDDVGQKRLFSQSFIQRHEEFGGDTRSWVRWARDEFRKIAEQERELLHRELSRQASEPGKGKPKWLVKVRVQTASHSLRQKTLNFWNNRIDAVKLRAVGNQNSELMLEMILNDHVKIEQVFDFGLAFSKTYLAMLNIGTAGFFWYELSGQEETYYESIQDLEAPNMKVSIGRADGLWREWSPEQPGKPRRQREALKEPHLNIAIMCLAAFASMPDQEAEPIFGPYIQGLTFLSKSDLHLSTANPARAGFVTALRRAMHKFGDLESENAALLPALHRIMEPIIREEAHRNQVFASLEGPGRGSKSGAVTAKRAADLYLALVARRLWPEFAKRASHYVRSMQPPE